MNGFVIVEKDDTEWFYEEKPWKHKEYKDRCCGSCEYVIKHPLNGELGNCKAFIPRHKDLKEIPLSLREDFCSRFKRDENDEPVDTFWSGSNYRILPRGTIKRILNIEMKYEDEPLEISIEF